MPHSLLGSVSTAADRSNTVSEVVPYCPNLNFLLSFKLILPMVIRKTKKNLKRKHKKFSQYKRWSFGTLNIRTGKENDCGAKIYTIAKEMSKYGMKFLLLQEVRWRGTGSKIIEIDSGEKYEFHWSGYKQKREAGVGILIKIDPDIEITNPDFNEPRVMGISLKVHGFNLRIVNVYSPTDCDGTDEQKRKFYSDVKKASKTIDKHQKLLIAGDFNASTGVARYKSNFDGKRVISDNNFNDNGMRLKQLCRSQNLNISSTFFKHRLLHRYTWYSNDKKTRKILDYILSEKYIQNYMVDCRVYRGFHVETDHQLLKATIYAPSTRKSRKKFCNNPKPPKRRINLKMLIDKDIREQYTNSLDQKLQLSKNVDADTTTRSKSLIDTLSAVAAETVPLKQRQDNFKQIFKDDECLNKLLDSRSHLNKGTEEYKIATKKIKKRSKVIRNEKYRSEAEQINHHATRRETEELFRSMKCDGSSFKTVKRSNK